MTTNCLQEPINCEHCGTVLVCTLFCPHCGVQVMDCPNCKARLVLKRTVTVKDNVMQETYRLLEQKQ
jgi:hypothetical protein